MTSDNILDTRNPFTPSEKARSFDVLSRQRLGVVVGGSLQEGVIIKLDAKTFVEGLAVGSYVTIDGQPTKNSSGLLVIFRWMPPTRTCRRCRQRSPTTTILLRRCIAARLCLACYT
jgi:hypothetical protein